MERHLETVLGAGGAELEQFIAERLKTGTLTAEELLGICALPKLKKRYFDMLLAGGANLRARDAHGRTVLFAAAESGNLVLLRALLGLKLDPMRRDDSGEIPLATALRCGNLSVAQCLLELTPAPAAVVDDEGSTLLHKAAWGDVTGIARPLVERYGLPADSRDRYGRTPLHVAAYQGSGKMLKYLLEECSADVDAADCEGRSPIFSAAYDGNLRALKILCEHGADSSVKDRNGLTALEFARTWGEFEATRFLSRRA